MSLKKGRNTLRIMYRKLKQSRNEFNCSTVVYTSQPDVPRKHKAPS